MSHNSQTNGGSLEDCHTNFFALTDLCGIKWRVYTWDRYAGGMGGMGGPPPSVDPTDDPVLSSYARCLNADVLCVWRRTWRPPGPDAPPCTPMAAAHHHQYGGPPPPMVSPSTRPPSVRYSPKELWIFWYGEEPDLSHLVSPELLKNDSDIRGSWDLDTGLSYECRTLLFKALHNLIERCLLSRGFVRLGKWFVEPYDGPEQTPITKSTHLSFCLSFFVHGESIVCASLDVRQHPPVRRLRRRHLQAAHQNPRASGVILGPYGLTGYLTGVSHRLSDPITQKLLDDWRAFFPMDTRQTCREDVGVPPVVEVVVGGCRMRYPTFYVLATDMDSPPGPSRTLPERPLRGIGTCLEAREEEGIHGGMSGVLRPQQRSPFLASAHVLLKPGYLGAGGRPSNWARGMCERVWQDVVQCPAACQSLHSPPAEATEGGGPLPAEIAVQYDLESPATKSQCVCSRCQGSSDSVKSRKGSGARDHCGPGRDGLALDPFHLRTSQSVLFDPHNRATRMELAEAPPTPRNWLSNSATQSCGGNNSAFGGYRGGGIGTPGSVPSVRLPGTHEGLPPSVESAASVTPSPLPTPHSQPASVANQDLSMPALSPQPPESNVSTADPSTPLPGESTECKANELASMSIPSVGNNQVMSSYAGANYNGSEDSNPATGRSVASATSNRSASLQTVLRRPALPDSDYDTLVNSIRVESKTNDYDALDQWLNHPVKKFKGVETKTQPPYWPPYRPSYMTDQLQIKEEQPEHHQPDTNGLPTRRTGGTKRSANPYDFDVDDSRQVNGEVKSVNTNEDEDRPDSTDSGRDPLSPSLGGKKPVGGNLFTNEGLQVSYADLEDIFEDSDSPIDTGLFPDHTPPNSNKPPNSSSEELTHPKCMGPKPCISSLGDAELTKMFPTPPSHEHNPEHESALDDVPLHPPHVTVIKQEKIEDFGVGGWSGGGDAFSLCCGTEEATMDAEVYAPPTVAMFVGSSRYAPLTNLPSHREPTIILPSECIYKPLWTSHFPIEKQPVAMNHANHIPMAPHLPSVMGQMKVGLPPVSPMMSVPMGSHHHDPYRGPGSVSAPGSIGTPLNYELTSPASNHPYLGKPLPSLEVSTVGPPSLVHLPEANALVLNIALQDSSVNLFRDHNFDSCTMCVCNNSAKVVGNVRGKDGALYLPPSQLSHEEESIACNCGFSAVANRRLTFQSGLFYEDEVDLTGPHELLAVERKKQSFQVLVSGKTLSPADSSELNAFDHIPPAIFQLLQSQCLVTLCASPTVIYRVTRTYRSAHTDVLNILDYRDGNEIVYQALEQARVGHVMDSDYARARPACVHKWCYLQFDGPACSQDIVRCMNTLRPYLQDAVQRRGDRRPNWEPVFSVEGPLTWRTFHRMAVRGTEDVAEPLPVPLVLAGHERDWLALAPQAVRHWERLLLEPYSQPRNVAYVVVAPDNEFILGHVRSFFKELSSVYELCRLGRHAPIQRVLRCGILRVSKVAVTKVANEELDHWFSLLGESQMATKLKYYAQVCRYWLAPHLAQLSMDKSLFEVPNSGQKPAPSPMPPPGSDPLGGGSASMTSSPSHDGESSSTSTTPGFGPGVSLNEVEEEETPPPAIVVYLVDPFSLGVDNPDLIRLVTMGLLRCYKGVLDGLGESMQNNVYLQIVSLESIMELNGMSGEQAKQQDQLKALAFSVFMQCRRMLSYNFSARSLTGFGPASVHDMFLKPGKENYQEEKRGPPYHVFSPAFILAPVKESRGRHKEAEEALGTPREKSTTLYVTYCLSEDQKWLLASATDELGELLETVIISVEVPDRIRRKKAAGRIHGLKKLMDWILSVMSVGIHPWRLVVGRLGRMGHGELKSWSVLLSRRALAQASKQLREMCRQCHHLFPSEAPCILSACLVSTEAEPTFRMMPDLFTPDERFSVNRQKSSLATPSDVSCTHILVFPTSATAQSAQQRFQDEQEQGFHFGNEDNLLGLGGEDLDDDMGGGMDMDMGMGSMGININDILGLGTGPGQDDQLDDAHTMPDLLMHDDGHLVGGGGSGRGGRGSPCQFTGQARCNGVVLVDPLEDGGSSAVLQQQPLALGYYVSTAGTGRLPRWFWTACPHLEGQCPVFLKAALHLHSPAATQAEEYMHNAPQGKVHPLDSSYTTDVLRYVLEGYNGLSWLVLDPCKQDRRSCLPIHIQVLTHLYNMMAALV